MTVRKRGDGRWQYSFQWGPEGNRRRARGACKGARNRSEALDFERKEKTKLELRGGAPAARAPLFEAFAPEFLQAMAASNKPSEVQSKESIIRLYLVPAFGALRLDQVGARQIETAKAEWLTGAAAKTVNNRLTCLHKLLDTAKEWGLLSTVPAIRWCRTEERELDFYTAEESARLLAAAEWPWRVMMLVGLRAGLRRGELLALRRQDVDLVGRKIVVRRSITRGVETDPKGRRSREVPMSPELAAALREHLDHPNHAFNLVFPGGSPGNNYGRHLTKGEIRWPMRRACRKAELRELGWHALRHSFASQLVMAGVSLKTVQELLGHTDIKITMRYAHLAPVVKTEAVALLDGGGKG